MKKALLLLALVCFISCTNNQQSNNFTDATDSVAVEEIVDVAEAPEVEDTEITLDFSSYHLYTCEEDKYDASGYQPVSAKVTIDEESKKASLKLYDSGENKWYPFNFRIDEKLLSGKNITRLFLPSRRGRGCGSPRLRRCVAAAPWGWRQGRQWCVPP